MKTKEELNKLKEEVETLNRKLAGLTAEEMKQVAGGRGDEVTQMECPCGYSTDWFGNFVGQVFDCPKCGKHTFKGIRIK